MKDYSQYSLPMEKRLSKQIYGALQGDVVKQLIEIANIPADDSYHRSILEGHSFKVEEQTLPHYYKLFNDVKQRLGFTHPVDFYITGNAAVNAYAISAQNDDEPHIVNVNSSLIELMTEDELQFVVGHELGHIINENSSLLRLINFIYPKGKPMPLVLQYKIRLWQQLSELVADRFGFIAMPKMNACISAFFKMSSGLDFDKMQMKVDAFLEDNNKRLEFFKKDKGMNLATHPINPIRVQALNLFSQSVMFVEGGASQDELQQQMDDLTEILLKVKNSEVDIHMASYVATAGLVIASADKEVSKTEIQSILTELSDGQIFPRAYLDDIAKQDVDKIFQESIVNILKTNPEYREGMLCYIMSIAIADQQIHPNEVGTVFSIATQLLHYSPIEVAQIFAGMTQNMFHPSIEVLC